MCFDIRCFVKTENNDGRARRNHAERQKLSKHGRTVVEVLGEPTNKGLTVKHQLSVQLEGNSLGHMHPHQIITPTQPISIGDMMQSCTIHSSVI
ncbi:unnamed protein product [Arctogadus glacialis]